MWRKHILTFVIFGAIQFLVLSTVAMFFYPGGNWADPNAPGYLFFYNFFSDLGLLTAHNGEPNGTSFVLWFVTLVLAGISLVLFFAALPGLFRQSKSVIFLSMLGSFVGIISGLCFIGIALTPADIFQFEHINFVFWAFIAFLIAALIYVPAIFLNKFYPGRYAFAFVGFTIILAAYVWLILAGPREGSEDALVIQATGQKIVVYAAVISIAVQAYGARKMVPRSDVHSRKASSALSPT